MPATESSFDSTGRQWAWDTVSINWLKDCPTKYKRFMLEGWRPKEENVHLKFGGIYAKALEIYHSLKAGIAEDKASHREAMRESVRYALEASWPWPFADTVKTRENLIRSIIWYLDNYEDDPCKTVTLSDGTPAVELATRIQLDEQNILIVHLDRIVEFLGHTYIQDQKTTKGSLGSYYFEGFNPDNQMSTYSVVGHVVYNTPVQGVMLDAAQILVGATRFERGFTYRTRTQLDEWVTSVKWWIGAYRDAAERADWPMNDTSCSKYRSSDPFGNAHGCPLRKVCGADPRVREAYLENDFVKQPWNPLEERK